jgi:hypothetical protein
MDDDRLRYPIGSKEHYAAYEKEFTTDGGIGYPFRDDPQGSYEVDYAYELAFDRYAETGGPDGGDLEEDNPDSGADREDADWPAFRREDPEPDLEPWLCRAQVRP